MISKKTHPELASALNNMTTVINRDHTDREWKQALHRVLVAFAVEIIHPTLPVTGTVKTYDNQIKEIMARIKEKQGPERTFDVPVHPCNSGKICVPSTLDPDKCQMCGTVA